MYQQPYYAGYPDMYGYNAMTYGAIPMPANQNALTKEEIEILKNARPTSKINVTIDRNDVLRSMCTHKDNGRDVVVQVNDGSGDVACPICGKRWNPNTKSKEEVEELVSELVSQMENAKWIGDLPTDLTRELFTLIPLLEKYPEIHEYAMNTFNKYYSARGMYNAQDANIYGMYNSLFGAGMPQPQGYYGQPMQGYYGQGQPTQQQYYGQPVQAQPQAYGYMPQAANPTMNPMQAPTYGVNPAAQNQQFVQQANTMMQGSVYGQPQMYQQQPMNAPVYGTPQVQQSAPVQPTTQDSQNNGPVVTPQADGSVKSDNKINL
jgi:hypothetical protein